MKKIVVIALISVILLNATMTRDSKKEVVYDNHTDLLWQDDKSVRTVKKSWQGAVEYCEKLAFRGYNDWRLPDIDELLEITDDTKYNPAIKKAFKNVSFRGYWSRSSSVHANNDAWIVDFMDGSDYYSHRSYEYLVRCVRDSKTLKFDSYKKLRFYGALTYALDREILSKEIVVKKKTGTLDDLLYTKKPFEEVSRLTRELIDFYLKPREIPKVKQPKLPKLAKFVKGEYETKAMFQERINKTLVKREAKLKALQEQYRKDVEARNKKIREVQKEQAYKEKILPQKVKVFQVGALKLVMGTLHAKKRSYDAEHELMYLSVTSSRSSYSKKIAVYVPLQNAQEYAQNLKDVDVKLVFDFTPKAITLIEIDTHYRGKTYSASLDAKNFKPEHIEVAVKDIKVKFADVKNLQVELQNPNLKDSYQMKAIAYRDGAKVNGVTYSDDIPVLLKKVKIAKISKKKWLFIVGVENYAETDNIKYAKRSALEFQKVAKKVLGVSERHCYTMIDAKATAQNIKNRMRLLLADVKKGDTIYFYYNGHGIPDAKHGGEPYMLPSDAIPDFIIEDKTFALKNIYKKLSDSKASHVVAFVDSCFSGATDGVSIIKGVAGSRLAPKKVLFDKEKMVVLTAGEKKQYSNVYETKGHRMMSYFVMKSLIEGKKDMNALFKEVSYKVSEASNELGPLKKQEPTLSGNRKIKL